MQKHNIELEALSDTFIKSFKERNIIIKNISFIYRLTITLNFIVSEPTIQTTFFIYNRE